MGEITLALLQLARPASLDEALERGLAGCREAAARGADIALLTEMWSNGYAVRDLDDPANKKAWIASAIGPDSEFIGGFRAAAREHGMAIAATYLEANGEAPRNTVSLIEATGEIVLTLTLLPDPGPGGSSPMRPERWSYRSWPVPASGSRCSSGAVVGYRRSRCTRIAQPWPRAG